MKTAYTIILMVLISLLMLNGLVLIFDKAGTNNYLDEESLALVSVYDSRFSEVQHNFTQQYNASKNLTNYQPINKDIGDFIKEYFEQKSRVDKLRNTINIAYKFPDLVFLSIPFIDWEEWDLYLQVLRFLFWVTLFIALILALKGILTPEQT